jgi:pimeloyl-ACP methyl ester carboxylesterase
MAGSIESFTITTEAEALADLTERLKRTRWPDALDDAGWDFGTNLDYMRELQRYWLEDYDWERERQRLNRFPHYRYDHDGLPIHFIHAPGKGPDPLPLLMTHGWPGSFLEMTRILPLLTDPGAHGGDARDAFTLIVPSIPGYGFSGRPRRRGMNVEAVADIWAELMTALGYRRFGAQGGDWGSWISIALGLRHPERLSGLHLNYVSTRFRPDLGPGMPPLTEEEENYLKTVARWADAEGAYMAIQGTKPQTLSFGLSDSPIGLAAWILEKFRGWSDNDGVPEDIIARDDLITNVMIYWLTNTIHSSMRFYSEARAKLLHLKPGERVTVPTGVVRLPREIPMPPRHWVERAFNLQHWTSLARGGHFAALEVPELLAADIRAFFRPLRS